MHITYIGLGYVGLVHSVLLASFGNDLIAYDKDKEKISLLKQGVATVEEPNLQTLLTEAKKYIRFTSNAHDAMCDSGIFFIAVDTPTDKNGERNLSNFYEVLDRICEYVRKEFYVVIRSSVPVGTNKAVQKYLSERTKEKFHVISYPEFSTEGHMVVDMLNTERIVVGCDDKECLDEVFESYNKLQAKKIPILSVTPESAELIDAASSALLATKISFAAELSTFAEKVGANIDEVIEGISLDSRIGGKYLKPGLGYGGPSLSENLKSLVYQSDKVGETMHSIKASLSANDDLFDYLFRKILTRFRSVQAKKIAVLGAAYKGGTEDIRDSIGIKIVKTLLDRGADVHLYDPLAEDNIRPVFSRHTHIKYFDYVTDALKGADFAIITTNEDEFAKLTPLDFKTNMRKPIVFDGRNIFKPEDMKEIEYYSIGRLDKIKRD